MTTNTDAFLSLTVATTGLPNSKYSPHLIALEARLIMAEGPAKDGSNGVFRAYILPREQNALMSPEAQRAAQYHRIPADVVRSNGRPLGDVVDAFEEWRTGIDAALKNLGRNLVGTSTFNQDFLEKVLAAYHTDAQSSVLNLLNGDLMIEYSRVMAEAGQNRRKANGTPTFVSRKKAVLFANQQQAAQQIQGVPLLNSTFEVNAKADGALCWLMEFSLAAKFGATSWKQSAAKVDSSGDFSDVDFGAPDAFDDYGDLASLM